MNNSPPPVEKITLRGALKDLGWFTGLFVAIVGGPSVLSLLQYVFVDHQLVPALQWVVDGYNNLTGALGVFIEPLIEPVIVWVNRLLDWNVTLGPYWRPYFILPMTIVIAFLRDDWPKHFVSTCARLVAIGLGVFFGAMTAGLMPITESIIIQGFATALPIVGMVSVGVFFTPLAKDFENSTEALIVIMAATFVVGSVVYLATGLLSTVPGMRQGAGFLSLMAGIFALGLGCILVGLSESRAPPPPWIRNVGERGAVVLKRRISALKLCRTGFVMIGGLLTAGLILAVDAVLRLLA